MLPALSTMFLLGYQLRQEARSEQSVWSELSICLAWCMKIMPSTAHLVRLGERILLILFAKNLSIPLLLATLSFVQGTLDLLCQ